MNKKLISFLAAMVLGVPAVFAGSDAVEYRLDEEYALSEGSSIKIVAEDAEISYVGGETDTLSLKFVRVVEGVSEEDAQALLDEHPPSIEHGADRFYFDGNIRKRRGAYRKASIEDTITLFGPRVAQFEFENEDGDLALKNLEGSVRVVLEDGNALLEDLKGVIKILSEDGNVVMKNVEGNATVMAEDGDVSCQRFYGELEMVVEDGDVEMEFADSPSGPCSIVTEDGDINLTLGLACKAKVTAKSEDGKITSKHEMKFFTSNDDEQSTEIELNGGGYIIALMSEDGDIAID